MLNALCSCRMGHRCTESSSPLQCCVTAQGTAWEAILGSRTNFLGETGPGLLTSLLFILLLQNAGHINPLDCRELGNQRRRFQKKFYLILYQNMHFCDETPGFPYLCLHPELRYWGFSTLIFSPALSLPSSPPVFLWTLKFGPKGVSFKELYEHLV